MLLTVERALIKAAGCSDGLMVDSRHIDVSRQHGIDTAVALGNKIGEIFQVLCVTYLINAVLFCQGIGLGHSCPTPQECEGERNE